MGNTTPKRVFSKGLFAINKKQIEANKQQFLKTIEDLKTLTNNNKVVATTTVLSLIQSFSNTFFTLESYDKNNFTKSGKALEIQTSAQELQDDLQFLKKALIKKGEASPLFAQEKNDGILKGIFGTVFQSVFREEAYPSIEKKQRI